MIDTKFGAVIGFVVAYPLGIWLVPTLSSGLFTWLHACITTFLVVSVLPSLIGLFKRSVGFGLAPAPLSADRAYLNKARGSGPEVVRGPTSTNVSETITQPYGTELYGTQHAYLNLTVPPMTWWFNMGYWLTWTEDYRTACEKLVDVTCDAAGVRAGSLGTNVLDVGFGCGDSCFLLADKYGCNVTGVTNELSQFKLANERTEARANRRRSSTLLTASSLTFSRPASLIHLFLGDASDMDWLLALPNSEKKYAHIISVDAAYHFTSRWTFLQSAFGMLENNGGIGLADICLSPGYIPGPLSQMAMNILCKIARIPVENLVTPAEYEKRMKAAGFSDISLEVQSYERVFGGLIDYIQRHGEHCASNGVTVEGVVGIRLELVKAVLRLLRGKVDFVIVGAKKA